MAKGEMSEKKPKRRSYAGIIFLVVLLFLIGTAGFLYYSVVKVPVELDNPQKMAASAPISAEERFRFSAADQTAQIKVGAADIWNFVLTHLGADFLDSVNRELSPYSLSVSGCKIHIDEKGLQLNLELFYKDIRLVGKIPFELEASGQHFCLKPTGVKLGAISLPVSDLLSSMKLEYDFQLPVVSNVTEVSYEQDAILITGTMEEDIHSLTAQKETLYRIAVFSEDMQPLVDSLETEAGRMKIFSHLEQKPGDIEDLYRDLFILAGFENTEAYLDSHKDLTQRVLPGIDFSTLEAERTELNEQVDALASILDQFFTGVVSDYNGKVFKLDDGEFLKKQKPFHPTNFGGGKYDAMFEVLNPDDFFLILVDVENGFIRKTPSFYKIADENQQFTQPVDFNKTYILGCVLRSLDGDPFLLYETETHNDNIYYRNLTLQPLTEDDVSALQVPGKFGVWTG